MMRIRLTLFVLLLGLILPWRVTAQDRALHWERYEYDVQLLENGDLRFTETQILAIDRGTFRFGTLSFDTGEAGRVRNVSVAEDGEPYSRGADRPGTFVASDDGQQFKVTYVFRDPSARQHRMTIGYTVGRALIAEDERATLTWNFLCGTPGCPSIDAGAITLRFPRPVDAASLDIRTSGAPVSQSASDQELRWELAGPIQATKVQLGVTFPRAILASTATFRSGAEAPSLGQPQPVQPRSQPSAPVASPGLPISPFFCLIILIVLFFLFSSARRSARRGVYMPRPVPRRPGPFGGFGVPRPRGRRGWGGRGGWGIPPIIIAPPSPRREEYGGPFSAPPDTSSGGGGSAWDNSGGGGSSWSDSGGGGSSWASSGGGGSSWSDSGGGGSSRGESRGGGGDNNSSSFG